MESWHFALLKVSKTGDPSGYSVDANWQVGSFRCGEWTMTADPISPPPPPSPCTDAAESSLLPAGKAIFSLSLRWLFYHCRQSFSHMMRTPAGPERDPVVDYPFGTLVVELPRHFSRLTTLEDRVEVNGVEQIPVRHSSGNCRPTFLQGRQRP